ncbi:MAG: hypothetical protein MJ078_06435 [Clostridia bacterium]|nr:hypothetical protein [Clostridia bacterium]
MNGEHQRSPKGGDFNRIGLSETTRETPSRHTGNFSKEISKMKKMLTPADFAQRSAASKIEPKYDWKKQESNLAKVGTGGNTNNYTAGRGLPDFDSWTD